MMNTLPEGLLKAAHQSLEWSVHSLLQVVSLSLIYCDSAGTGEPTVSPRMCIPSHVAYLIILGESGGRMRICSPCLCVSD